MKIDTLTLKNFRNVEDERTFIFDSSITAVIGRNGKGKSTVLHGLRIACGAYFLGIPDADKRHIHDDEIRRKDFGSHLGKQFPTIVKATGSICGQKLVQPWLRQRLEGKTKTTFSSAEIGEIRDLATSHYNRVEKDGKADIDLPVIAFFGTERLQGAAQNRPKEYIGREIFSFGYYSWATMRYSSFQYASWLRGLEYRIREGKEQAGVKSAYYGAIRKAIPFIQDIEFDGQDFLLRVKIEDEVSGLLPLSLHSDGIITFTSMVAELAYRCIVLNSHHGEDAVNKSQGVVMIDEIDLHIHPEWQRQIIQNLREAFPAIQFIVTTHSPFITQSLTAAEIINLDEPKDVDPNKLRLDEVATSIMGVENPYSKQNEELYEASKKVLEGIKGDKTPQEIQDEIDAIHDPAVRAFLELNKMANGK